MSYYSQRITNRASNRNDNDDLNGASGEQSLGNPYLNKKIYENNYKPGNLIPSAPFENSSYQNNPVTTKNVNYINNNSNKGNVVTSPFGNHLNIEGDINKKSDAFFNNYNTSNKHKTCKSENKQDDDEDAEDELPLLEELGINFDLIAKRMKSVFMFYKVDHTLFENSDLSGPLIIVLSLGFILLLAGKASFSYIYLIGIVSSVSIYLLLNMMSQNQTLDLYRTISMLGYALLPLVILSFISIIINLRSKKGYSISFFCISWSALTASHFFEVVLLKKGGKRLFIPYMGCH
ncbi:protein transport protein YIP1, putative [Plasmodium ovale]|uniref:Protein transport protein YIP1, putative n=1 Tax=Plasmodium ovale TaxID=36330 RepID=A0A1C3KVK4_PLAOA|nr:protein transport protein YIP1, putative [Plasmodium ovale]